MLRRGKLSIAPMMMPIRTYTKEVMLFLLMRVSAALYSLMKPTAWALISAVLFGSRFRRAAGSSLLFLVSSKMAASLPSITPMWPPCTMWYTPSDKRKMARHTMPMARVAETRLMLWAVRIF